MGSGAGPDAEALDFRPLSQRATPPDASLPRGSRRGCRWLSASLREAGFALARRDQRAGDHYGVRAAGDEVHDAAHRRHQEHLTMESSEESNDIAYEDEYGPTVGVINMPMSRQTVERGHRRVNEVVPLTGSMIHRRLDTPSVEPFSSP
ncbi:hypothetical protein ACN2WE_00685 [Streptomyces sp. cg28]|uniref:hypothetical protein n=1 Tax=Streptomyces sp. cg28 TaxID=3403457 RepID=UPI003B2186C1